MKRLLLILITYFRLFFEQHFNTDKARASFFGLTYYF